MVEQSDMMLLGKSQLLEGLSEAQLDLIHAVADVAWFDKGAAITQAGEWGTAAYLVVSGNVIVADAPANSGYQDILGPGTFIGELAMLTEVTYAATVVAAEPLRALVIQREALYAVLEDAPEIAEHISDKLARRLSSLADDLRAVDERFEALETSLERIPDAA
jgi:CRP-like cAMP-binding protein